MAQILLPEGAAPATPGTTNGDDFIAFITRINGFSHLAWQAQQWKEVQ